MLKLKIGLAVMVMGMVLALACAPAAPPATPTAAPTAAAKAAPAPTSTAAPTVTPTRKPPEPVKVHIASKSVTQMVFAPAIEKGYYRDEGLDVSLALVAAAVGVKAMIAGEFHFSGAGASAVVANFEGAPTKLIMSHVKGIFYWLYAAPGIKSFADLKGKTIGVGSMGAIEHVSMRTLLSKRGLDPDKDVVFVATGGPAPSLGSLKGGSVAAASLTVPTIFEADKAGFQRLAFLPDEVPSSVTGIATTDRLIKERPDLVKGFVKATLKSLRFIQANKEEHLPIMEKFLEIDREEASRSYDAILKAWLETGIPEPAVLAADIDMERRRLEVKETVPVERVFDLSFARQASEELKREGWKP